MSFSLSILAIVLGSSLCEALIHDFPRATAIQDPLFDGVGWSPRPTAAPIVPRELFEKRDFLANSASFVLIAPDQTCGYVSALAGKEVLIDVKTKAEYSQVHNFNAERQQIASSSPLQAAVLMGPLDVAQIR